MNGGLNEHKRFKIYLQREKMAAFPLNHGLRRPQIFLYFIDN